MTGCHTSIKRITGLDGSNCRGAIATAAVGPEQETLNTKATPVFRRQLIAPPQLLYKGSKDN